MEEKVIYYPGTNKVFIKVDVDEKNNINGKINIYDKVNSTQVIQKLVVKDDVIRMSEIKQNNITMKLVGDSKEQNFILERNNNKVIEFLGLKFKNNKLEFEGTTSTLYGRDFSINSTLIRNGSLLNILSEMKLVTENRLSIGSNYREVGTGNYILSSHLTNNTGIELLRKVYKEGNYLKPVYVVVKDITEDEIHGVYNGNQVPTLGKAENLS